MARNRVDPTHPETPAEKKLADELADYGPSVESIIGTVPPSPNPYDPAKAHPTVKRVKDRGL